MVGDTSLRRIYAEACQGYSTLRRESGLLYVRHLTIFDQTEIDHVREIAFQSALSRGLKTQETQLAWLASKGLWTKKDETELVMQRGFVDSTQKTKSRLALKSQMDQVDKQLKEATTKLNELANKRTKLIGLTAEHVADQRVQYEYIRLSFFGDSTMKEPMFAPNDIVNLTDEETDHLLFDYIQVVSQFGPEALRKIAVAPFFTNCFYLCGEDIPSFFGKPMVDLTLYQTNLLSYGQYFRSILTQNDLPKEILNNPDKIEDYVMRSRNLKSIVDKAGSGDRMAIIGATKDDLKTMGVEDSSDKVRADIGRGVRSGMEAAQSREVAFTNPR